MPHTARMNKLLQFCWGLQNDCHVTWTNPTSGSLQVALLCCKQPAGDGKSSGSNHGQRAQNMGRIFSTSSPCCLSTRVWEVRASKLNLECRIRTLLPLIVNRWITARKLRGSTLYPVDGVETCKWFQIEVTRSVMPRPVLVKVRPFTSNLSKGSSWKHDKHNLPISEPNP